MTSQDASSALIEFDDCTDTVIQRAIASYHQQSVKTLKLEKVFEAAAHFYDVQAMDKAVAILFWGRSGSLLLSSYLDGHDDVIVMPGLTSGRIYHFFTDHPNLNVWQKLVAYPTAFENAFEGAFGEFNEFFSGRFPIDAAAYYAAVHALRRRFESDSAVDLESRKTFFKFVHVATHIATQRPRKNPRPLLIHSQHWFSDELATKLVDDFPKAQFIHTVRDPISSFDSWFDHQCSMDAYELKKSPDTHFMAACLGTFQHLCLLDRPQHGVEPRSRAVRFEDLHVHPERVMKRVADWIGIKFSSCLVDSTFNGVPWVNVSGGKTWVGPSPSNAARRSRHMGRPGRILIYTLMAENFVAWGYPMPAFLRHKSLRIIVAFALWSLLVIAPMRMEWLSFSYVTRGQIVPALGDHRIAVALRAMRYFFTSHARLAMLIAFEYLKRLRRNPPSLVPI